MLDLSWPQSYWVVVITVLLNLIFGIIIDTFSELRTLHAANKNMMENTCFICGVDRFTFDAKGGGFNRHTAHDHNMWMYLFMLCAIWDKDEDDYNGWEQHVADRLAAKEVDFLPRNNAIVLREITLAEEAEMRNLRDSVAHVHTEVDKMAAKGEESNGQPLTVAEFDEAFAIQSAEMHAEMKQMKTSLQKEMSEMKEKMDTILAALSRSPSASLSI